MVDLVQQYDTEAEASNFDALPAGNYEAQIVESAKEPISKNEDKGDCLNLCWQVTSGPYEKRLFWQRIMLWFSGSEKTPGKVVQIANQQFASVREATGQKVVNDSEELHHIPCLVAYGPQKNDDRYSEVKSVKPLGGSVKQLGRAATATAPAAAASTSRAPWPRKTA